jgi:hypothetical protein
MMKLSPQIYFGQVQKAPLPIRLAARPQIPARCRPTVHAGMKSICAEQFHFRAAINRFVRSFSGSCGNNSTCAGHWQFRAGQLPVRAGKNPSVRPFFDLCEEMPHFRRFWRILVVKKRQF